MYRNANAKSHNKMIKEHLVNHIQLENYDKKGKRKSFILNICLSFFNISSIHGLGYVIAERRHFLERWLWILAVSAAMFGTLYAGVTAWQRFQRDPIVISVERDYQQWNTTFPALTFCPTNKINEEALQDFVRQKFRTTADQQELTEFIHQLADTSYKSYNRVPKFGIIPPADYASLIMNVSFKFKFDEITSNLKGFNGGLGWVTTTLSELGICYTLHSKIAKYFNPRYTGTQELVESLVGNPLYGDVFMQIIYMNSGGKMYLHNNQEIPNIASKGDDIPALHFRVVEVTALSIVSAAELTSLSIQQRRCQYLHENTLLLSPIYSYNLCRMDCRVRLIHQLCGCIPYFYWTVDRNKFRTCNEEEMQCIAHNKERLLQHEMAGTCRCLPPCDDTTYLVDTNSGIDWHLGANYKLSIIKYPRIRYKRDILFGFTDFLVAIGGSAGLFLGCSVLSFVEIIFWMLRPLFQSIKHILSKIISP